jgi:quinoprotein glucose dehydrogenase
MMDIVLHPQFGQNRWVYVAYHKPTSDGVGATTLMRATWDGASLVDGRDIFEPGAVDTEASRTAFDRRGILYLSISAPGCPQVWRAQDPNDYAGKAVRLRDDGTIPPDNPFVNKPGYKPGIYTLGHRNGHSMALNPETREFRVTEQGPNGGDEVNVLKPGANYGWPYVSNGRNYMGPKISDNPRRQELEPATELGAANEQVYGELLKLTRDEVSALRAAGVI